MQKIKKGLFLLFSAIIVYVKLTALLGDFDEIWTFNSARNLAAGNIVYKDFNLVVLPFFHFFVSIFLRLFGKELIVYRLVQIALLIYGLFISWKILEKLKLDKYILFYILTGWYFYMSSKYVVEYNYLSLVLTLTIIYVDLFCKENKYNKYVIGLLCALSILTKQTVGVLITLVTAIKHVILIVKKQEKVSCIFELISGGIIPIIVFLLYLLINNCFGDALDYTMFSANDFLKNGRINFISENIEEKISLFLIVSGMIIFLYIKEKNEIIYTLFGYACSLLIISFPIMDFMHLKVSVFIFLILCLYGLKIIGVNPIFSKIEKFDNFVGYFMSCFGIITLFLVFSLEISDYRNFNIKHIRNIPVNEGYINHIQEVADYTKSDDYIILESYASIYSIINDKYAGVYDVLLNGNLGSKGYKKIIEDLNNNKGKKVLIISDVENNNWQFPTELYYYVVENYEKIDEFNGYDVYQIN